MTDGRNHVFHDHPPFVQIDPSPGGWEWAVLSDFGEREDRSYRYATWEEDGDWRFRWSRYGEPLRGTRRTKKWAERDGRRALQRLARTVAHLEQEPTRLDSTQQTPSLQEQE